MTSNDSVGTVISGTMRLEDLIPAFCDELRARDADHQTEAHQELLAQIGVRSTQNERYYESEDAMWDLESLFDALSDHAPDGYYFGAHEGDGSDYGYWQPMSDDWRETIED
jgi:hypothetical protein